MKRKKIVLFSLLSLLLIYCFPSVAQKNTDSKIYLGGTFSLQFGTYTLIDISPLAGYKVTEKFHVGAGLTYTYYKYQEDGTYNGSTNVPGASYETSIYGGRLFTRYFVTGNLFLHVEDELINLELPDEFEYNFNHRLVVTRQWLNSILVGGGYGYQFNGDGAALSISVLFRVNDTYSDFYPYQNPIIRIGLGFGL